MSGTPKAVLFDFSGTLFRFTDQPEWFAELHDENGQPLHLDHQMELIRRMTQPVGLPAAVEDDDRISWERRDLDPAEHRRAYLAILRASGLSVPGQAESLYERVLDPASWEPFDDTATVLRGLKSAGVPVGIVSNIAFDVRKVLERVGLRDLVDAYALSYEVGAIKPNPRIFEAALDELGIAGYDALMIGDSSEADGGATRIGSAFELVHDVPPQQRPTALVDAVERHGIALS